MTLYELIVDLLYKNPAGMIANDIARALGVPWLDVNNVLKSYKDVTFERVPNTFLWRLTQTVIRSIRAASTIKNNNASHKKIIGRDILNLLNDAYDGMSLREIAYQLNADENEVKSVIRRLDNICHYNYRTGKWSLHNDKPETNDNEIYFSDLDSNNSKSKSPSLQMPTNEEEAKDWIKRYPQRVLFFKNNDYYRVYDENAVVLARADSRLDFIANNRFIDVDLSLYNSVLETLKRYHVSLLVIDEGEIISQIEYEYDNSYISFFAISKKTSSEIRKKITRRKSYLKSKRDTLSWKEDEIVRLAEWNDENLRHD